MKHLSSRDNPAVKALHKLAAGGGRRDGRILLDGVHLCQAWLAHQGTPLQALFDVARLDHPCRPRARKCPRPWPSCACSPPC